MLDVSGSSAQRLAQLQMEFDPDLSHLLSSDYEHVYEPAEDSYLMMDALHSERLFLHSRFTHPVCVEVGSGSGVLLAYLSRLLTRRGVYWATDINPRAAAATRRTMAANKSILLFNPPYVPTDPSELLSDGIERSWAGGLRGRQVLDRLVESVDRMLAADGVWYCVMLKENEPEEVRETMRRQGWESAVVRRRKAGREDLQIVKFSRAPPTTTNT